MKPLVYSVCYGSDAYFEAAGLMIESLRSIGEYRGDILLVSDRLEHQALEFITSDFRHGVKVLYRRDLGYRSRYDVGEDIDKDCTPIMYLDTDIIIGRPLENLLSKVMVSSELVCACDERANLEALTKSEVQSLVRIHELANWFGYSLMLADAETRKLFMPILNSGVLAFSNLAKARSVFSLVTGAMEKEENAALLAEAGDQPFLNYAVAKAGHFNSSIFANECAFYNIDNAPSPGCVFHHFLWARGNNKPRGMRNLLQALRFAHA